jgi:fluoride exporter
MVQGVNLNLEPVVMTAFIAIGFGAAIGAWLRWGLGLWLNPVFPSLPYGTLAANLLGGYLVGVAIAYFVQHPGLSPEWRLLVMTGFLGGLTTFSTFSAEVFTLISRNQLGWALTAAAAHLFGSLAMTALGVWTYKLLRG